MTMSPADLSFVSRLVHEEAGLVVGPGKGYLVEHQLVPLARAAGVETVGEYVALLRHRCGPRDVVAVVEAMTINETSWFRDREPFEAVVETVVPELLTRDSGRLGLTVWSAACSSGQEPYSLAMLMADHVMTRGREVEIIASDISGPMVERTSLAHYSQHEIGRGMPESMLGRHLHREGARWQVSPRIRSMVRARRINLAVPFPPLPVFDLVFLRNVLIYFDVATKRSVLHRVRQVLSPQGYLVLGAGESTLGVDDQWARMQVGRATLHRPLSRAVGAAGRPVSGSRQRPAHIS